MSDNAWVRLGGDQRRHCTLGLSYDLLALSFLPRPSGPPNGPPVGDAGKSLPAAE